MRLLPAKLHTRLLVAFLMVGLIPFTIIGAVALVNAQKALSLQKINHLKSIRDAKKMSIQHFFANQISNVKTLAKVGSVITATEMLEEAFHFGGNTINNNKLWDALSTRYYPAMENYIKEQGYRDLYFISSDGCILFSVAQKSDLGQNILEGDLKNSSLGKCFQKALLQQSALSDFEIYEPHNNSPAAFAAALVKRGNDVSGAVVLYIPIEAINNIMTERSGLGETGETYLVGNDKLMRSDSYLDPQKHAVFASLSNPGQGIVDTVASREALAGITDAKIIDNYLGVSVISAFTPLKVNDMTWALIAETDVREAFASIDLLRHVIGLAGSIGITLILAISLLVARKILGPIKKLTEITEDVGKGKLDVVIEPTLKASADEIGILATAFDTMTARLKASMEDLTAEIAERMRLTVIIESTSDIVSIATPDECLTYMNLAGRKLLGWEIDENINKKTIKDAHPEWALEIILKNGIPAAIQDEVWIGETAILKSDGTEIPVSQVIMSHKSPAGDVEYFSTIIRDISKLKQAEKALRESEERFRELAELLPETIYEIDLDGNLSFVNRQAPTQFGYTRNDFARGLNWFDMIIPEDRNRALENIKKIIAGENLGLREYQALRKDGTTFPALFRSTAIIREGQPIGLRGFIIDITERKNIEEVLRESEEKYRLLVKHAPAGIYEFDMQTFRFISVNDVMCEYTGYTKDEFLNLDPFELIAEESRPTLENLIQQVFAGNHNPGPVEYQIRGKNNRLFWVLVNSNFLFEDGIPKKSMAVVHDLTSIKQAEEEKKKLETHLYQVQKLESLGTLAGGIAHDFNNLLMGIQGRTSLMLAEDEFSHIHLEHLKGIEEYVKSAADLTRQLLAFARGGKYEVKPTDLNELVNKSAEMFGRTKKEISIHIKNQKDIWTVDVDRSQIDQVLLNLYVNAWQSMPSGGELYLETENVILGDDFVKPFELESGKYVKISVSDTGIGMDAATQEKIFDPFFTTKEMGRGTGLGLASAYGIIKNHGGIIDVYSEKGKGATFIVCLPASEKEIAPERESDREILKGAETILLVDDEDMIINVGKALLNKLGYNVLISKNGKSAVEIYQTHKNEIDMVILDMVMPDMGGGETYDRLKKINPEIKVLLSSGYSIDGQAAEILERGCNGFIQKPFDLKQLSQKIRAILDKPGNAAEEGI